MDHHSLLMRILGERSGDGESTARSAICNIIIHRNRPIHPRMLINYSVYSGRMVQIAQANAFEIIEEFRLLLQRNFLCN